MIVYIYDKKTDKKIDAHKGVTEVKSTKNYFHILKKDQIVTVDKGPVKLVVYGF